jgi:hypothetical protein
MASGKYEYLSQTLLNFIFNGGSWSAPADLYLALFTVAPSISSKGTEATGGGYARLSVTCNTTNWPTISSSTTTITNNVAQTMFTASGSVSSGSNMTDAGFFDSLTSGGSNNLYYWGDLTTAKPILTSDTPSFAVSAITVQEL